jgi:hypothetical protein
MNVLATSCWLLLLVSLHPSKLPHLADTMNSAPLVACRLHSASNFHQSIGNIWLENGWLQAFNQMAPTTVLESLNITLYPKSLKSAPVLLHKAAQLMLPLCLCIDKSMFIRQCIAWTARIPLVVVNRWYHGWWESFYVHKLYSFYEYCYIRSNNKQFDMG